MSGPKTPVPRPVPPARDQNTDKAINRIDDRAIANQRYESAPIPKPSPPPAPPESGGKP